MENPSSSNSIKTYDVFLSFRSVDTRGSNFTGHLYHALSQKGILTFMYDDMLDKGDRGEDFSSTLFKAIEESECSVVIISENYASSTWCLDELVEIVECMKGSTKLIFPIFYHVEPSEVRRQEGSFGEAFRRHEERFGDSLEKVQRWRSAITIIADIAGYHIHHGGGPEWKIVQEVTELIWKRVFDVVETKTSLIKKEKAAKRSNKKVEEIKAVDVERLPGMDSLVNDFHSSLCESLADVRFIGICGISGIGKTTLAEVYYRLISNNFHYKSFLRNVKSVCEKKGNTNGLVYLQTQLLSDILEEKVSIADDRSGMDMIKNSLCDKKVVIVLDDVDTLDQLKALAEKDTWFGSGSIVIVTTKDERLPARMYEECIIHRVEPLKDREALQLFSWKSFENRNPSPSYVILSREMIKHANGVPLALEVLGSFLWTKDFSKWESTLDRLREYRRRMLNIVDILQICFDELKELEKHIFLDIAYFFNGCQKDYVTKIMEDSGFSAESGIIVLNRKSLLRIDDNTLWMHELLQEMGREIVRKECQKEPEGRSRLWDVHYCPYFGT